MKRIGPHNYLALMSLILSGTLGVSVSARPTASVEVIPAPGVAPAFTAEVDNFAAYVRVAINAEGTLSIVDRDEVFALMEEREFSQMMSAPGEQIQTGMDASAQYLIRIKVGRFDKTGVQRGPLRSEYIGRAAARVVDSTRGVPLASVPVQIKDFFQNDTDAVIALAEELAAKVAEAVKAELAKAARPPARDQAGASAQSPPSGGSQILRIRPDGTVMLSDDTGALQVGDLLQVYEIEEFEDPRNPGVMLSDEIPVGKVEVTRLSAGGALARPHDGTSGFEVLMVARKVSASSVADSRRVPAQRQTGAASSAGHDDRADIMRGRDSSAVRPSLHIGQFRYSNEFDLSQTSDRSGRSTTGDSSGATLGAIAGGLVAGGKPAEWIGGAAVGAVGGTVVDQERRRNEERRDQRREQTKDEQRQTAIEKDSAVLREMVATRATASGRFDVIEDTRMDEVFRQMDRELDGNYDVSSLPQRGGLQGAKYSAFGTILRFETNRRQTGFGVVGGREQVEMTITLALRVVDNETGRMEISDQVTGSITTGSQQVGFLGFGTASENEGAIGELMDALAQSIVSKIVTTLYPIQIITVNAANRMVTINAGSTIVARGDRLSVIQPGEDIIDPYSGMVLGSAETVVGEIEIVEALPGFSHGRVIRPVANIGAQIKNGHICRPALTQAGGTSTPRRGF